MAGASPRVQPDAPESPCTKGAARRFPRDDPVPEPETSIEASTPRHPSVPFPAPRGGRRRPPHLRLRPATVRLTAVLLLVLGGCGPGPEAAPDGAPRIIATIFPAGELARAVGGPEVDVRILLPAGAAPATFEPTPRTIREARRADVILFLGGGLDAWVADLAADDSPARTFALLDGLELRREDHGEGTGNPHVWLDPVRVRDHLLPRIVEALEEAVPTAAPGFRSRARVLADTLTALDREIRSALDPLERRAFVASHAAWAYFAERYGLRQVGVVHEHPGQEPSARGLAALVEEARRAGVPVVFSEPQVPDAAARALALELDVPVLPLDPLGGVGVEGRDSYTGLMRYNTGQFVRGLGEPPPATATSAPWGPNALGDPVRAGAPGTARGSSSTP